MNAKPPARRDFQVPRCAGELASGETMKTKTFFDAPNDDSPVEVYVSGDGTELVFRTEDECDILAISVVELDNLINHLHALKREILAGE